MTLRKLASQIRRILTKGVSRDSQYKEKVVVIHVRQSINEVIKGGWEQAGKGGKKSISEHYIATYYLPVKNDPKIKRDYVDVSFAYLNIGNHQGIQRVAPVEDDVVKKAMIPVMPMIMDLYGDSAVGLIEGQWGYEPAKGKLLFTEKCGKTLTDKGIKEVEVKSVGVDPDDIGMDDPLMIPPEIENLVIKTTLELLGLSEQAIKDMLNDSNPDSKQPK